MLELLLKPNNYNAYFCQWKEFYRDAEELLIWMEEKFKVAEDESYRDPTNVLRKLKKHEAAEKEMQANQVRLDRLIEVRHNKNINLMLILVFFKEY